MNNDNKKDWKKFLLKSGLPFEYEVKECFVKHGCTVWDEYSYMKFDENQLEKEFSFDQYANLWINGNSIDFLIECKYKTEPTKWFFTPDPYAYQSELSPNDFMHPFDHFIENKFLYSHQPFDKILSPLGPYCLKGIEIYQNNYIEKNIFSAINQLSYGFIDHLLNSIENQLSDGLFKDSRYFHIPVIITNAELYRINEGVTTSDIESAESIESISKREDFLLYHNKIGEDLRSHNYDRLSSFFDSTWYEVFKKRNKSFTKDFAHYVSTISGTLSPLMILIMHHDVQHKNYQKLFDYIRFLLTPSDELKERTLTIKRQMEAEAKEMQERYAKIKKKKKKKSDDKGSPPIKG